MQSGGHREQPWHQITVYVDFKKKRKKSPHTPGPNCTSTLCTSPPPHTRVHYIYNKRLIDSSSLLIQHLTLLNFYRGWKHCEVNTQHTATASWVINISSLPWDLVLLARHNFPAAPGEVCHHRLSAFARPTSQVCVVQVFTLFRSSKRVSFTCYMISAANIFSWIM